MRTTTSAALTRVTERLQQLIILGQSALYVARGQSEASTGQDDYVAMGQFQEWRLASLSFLEGVLGLDNRYYKAFDDRVRQVWNHASTVQEGLGILKAVKGELEWGALPNVEGLIFGEIFTDFLDMADHLMEQGFVEVIPSLVGAVLEDGLRRMARRSGIPVHDDSDTIGSLNSKLADRSVYSNFVRKKVDFWKAVRNNADHGHFDENKDEDIRQMLAGVRDFLGTYLT